MGLLGLCVLLGGACARSSPAGAGEAGPHVSSRAAADPPVAAVHSAATLAPDPPEPGAWTDALRVERWKEAASLVDALPAAERDKPGVRYARARAAAHLGDFALAARLLDGLEAKLPLLAPEIAHHRAEAQLEAGPFDAAARFFAAQPGASAALDAATAFDRAKQPEKARSAVARALSLLGRARHPDGDALARAHALRAQLAQADGNGALARADLRWLAVHAPSRPEGNGVELSAPERLERLEALADMGRVDDVDREAAALAEVAKGDAGELLYLRAWARYRARRDYAEAAKLFSRAAQTSSKNPVRDVFFAARALSRAGDDAKAIDQYDQLVRRFPKAGFAETARYLAARLDFILGHWKEAASRYTSYLARYKDKGRYAQSARYERAVAWLAGDRPKQAARELAELRDATNDDRLQARYRELEGVALASAGDKAGAAARYQRVIADLPLSFPALAAATRLGELGKNAPPPIAPPESGKAPAPLDVALPPKVALLAGLGLDGEAEQALADDEDALRRDHGGRGDEALCEAYGKLATAARRYHVGQRAVSWSHLDEAPSAATQWMWDCIYPRPYEPVVRDAEKEWNLPHDLVYAVMRQESGFSPDVVSPANAVGLLQLVPGTARHVASELDTPFDPLLLESPPYNIRLGAFYLGKVLKTFGGNVALAAAAYNAGPAAVTQWLKSGEHLPLDVFVARIPFAETRGYVCRVIGNMARYAYLDGGEKALPALSLDLPRGMRADRSAY